MAIKAVLFDLDGTLLDRDASLALFVSDQYDRLPPLQSVEKAIFAQRFIELDNHGYVWKDKVYRQLIEEFSIAGMDWQTLLSDYLNGFKRFCIGFPHLLPMLTELKSRGLKIALVSNGYGQFQFDNFEALGISPLFDEVLISEWEELRKPDPAIFMRALNKLGVKAEEAVFVGDHLINDIKASRAVGMKAVWKRNLPLAPFDDAFGDADGVIDDLGELVQIALSLPSVPANNR